MFSKRKNKKFFKEMSYYDSIDFDLALQLKKYQIDPKKVVVWYHHVKKDITLFQIHPKYYKLEKGVLSEVSEKEVWKKSR